jgi:hypothetical protein
LYEKKYPGSGMLWYSVRDNLFAPFNIGTANYTEDWQLRLYAFLARSIPILRHFMIRVRTWRRKRHAVPLENLHSQAKLVIGHFAVNKLLPLLPPSQHEYRTVVRDPLVRMWSHFNHFRAHKGDVGHRVVPKYREDMTFEEFCMLPEMRNYQVQAVGTDISIYKHIGVTERLDTFSEKINLIGTDLTLPKVNHFGGKLPPLSVNFLEAFRAAHAQDYELYNSVLAKFYD